MSTLDQQVQERGARMTNHTIDAVELTDDDTTKLTAIPAACIAHSATRCGIWNAYSLLPVRRLLGEYNTEREAQGSAERYTDRLIDAILHTM